MSWSRELWERASAATPGRWLCWRDDTSAEVWVDEKDINVICRCVGTNQKGNPSAEANANALFISSVNPETVMSMLEVIEVAKNAVEHLYDRGLILTGPLGELEHALDKFEGNYDAASS